jgi:hypothetical protein
MGGDKHEKEAWKGGTVLVEEAVSSLADFST